MLFNYISNNNSNIVNKSISVNPNKKKSRVSFKQNYTQDTFQSNSPERLFNEVAIRKLIAQNPEVTKILDANKLPVHLNIKELQELKNGHCKVTQDISMAIFKHLPEVLRKNINPADLKDGAFLHDFGKVLIPPEILNKESGLTTPEHKIMDLHTELGYQLLKPTNFNENVKNIVRMHHHNYDKTAEGLEFIPDISLQIVNLADKYSALTEKRCYKGAFSTDKALGIIAQDVKDGTVHPLLYKALSEAIKNNEIH